MWDWNTPQRLLAHIVRRWLEHQPPSQKVAGALGTSICIHYWAGGDFKVLYGSMQLNSMDGLGVGV